MNRKIILLPLAAVLSFGLAACGPDKSDDSSVPSTGGDDTSSVTPVAYDGGISNVEVGDVQVSGVVAQIGSKGWVLDDGKASVYVFGTLASEFKVGDHVLVSATCEAYWGLYELKSATVTAAPTTQAGPTLSAPTEITAADINGMWNITSKSSEKDASWSPTNSKRYKITGLTAEDVSGYAGWSIDGFEKKLVPYYYVPGNNVTEANRSTKLYAGCKYDVSFYMIGNNKDKNVNMGIFDVTAHYDAVESVNVTGDANVEVGSSVSLTASVLPATADQGLIWSSSDDTKATVSSSGEVTGVAEGSVTIAATSTADSSKKKEFAMTVSKASKVYNDVASISFASGSSVTVDDQTDADPAYAVYTSADGLSIKAEAGTSTYGDNGINLWTTSSTYGNAAFYAGNNMVIGANSNFDRIIITAQSTQETKYKTLDASVLPEGATLDTSDDYVHTITLAAPATSATLTNLVKQIRVSEIKVQLGVAA